MKIAKANQDFIRLRQNTPQLAAGRFIVSMDFFSKSTVYLSDQHLSLPNTASTIAASISGLGFHLYSSV